MKSYARFCPRGFSNEICALSFDSRAERDEFVARAAAKADCNSATRGAWPCTSKEAERIAARNRAATRAHRRNSAEPKCFGAGEIAAYRPEAF